MKTLILIPTYNESKNIYKLAVECKKLGDVLVLDSSPNQETIMMANRARVKTEYIEGGMIADKTIKGLEYAIENNYDWVITIDAGGSHTPGQVMPDTNFDIVLGSRFLLKSKLKDVNWSRKLISIFARIIFNILWFDTLTDVSSGHRAYSVNLLKKLPLEKLRAKHFEFQIEMLSLCKKFGASIMESPITYKYSTSTFELKYIITAFLYTILWRL